MSTSQHGQRVIHSGDDVLNRLERLDYVRRTVIGGGDVPADVLDFLADLDDAFSTLHFIPAGNLVGVKELAEMFDVGRTTVCAWAARYTGTGFPEPVVVLGNGPVYDGQAVVDWWKAWTPVKGRKAGSLPWERTPSGVVAADGRDQEY